MGACVRVRDGWGDGESPGLAGATCAGGDFSSLALTYGLHQRREVGLLGTGEDVRGCFSAFGRAELDISFAVFLLGEGSSERQRTQRGGTEAERPLPRPVLQRLRVKRERVPALGAAAGFRALDSHSCPGSYRPRIGAMGL